MKYKFILLCLLLLAGVAGVYYRGSIPPDYTKLASAEDFRLLDEAGKSHELFRLTDKRAIVIIAQLDGCPIIQKSYPAIEALKKKFSPLGVEFLFINASPQDDRKSIQQEKATYGFSLPVLRDESRTIADSLGLTRSTEAVVIVPGIWKIVYRGAIDNRFDYHGERTAGVQAYLYDAISSVLDDKPVRVPESTAKGCNIAEQKPVVTFREVAPIMQAKCMTCHSTQGVPPTNMTSYREIRGWAPMIREVIRTGRMPPWPADSYYGKFEDDPSLTPEEARKIILWIQSGMPFDPAKDPEKIASARPAPKLEKPDIILTPGMPDTLSASGPQEYRIYYLGQVKKDSWVTSLLMRDKFSPQAAHHFDLMFSSEHLSPLEVSKHEVEEIQKDLPQENILVTSGIRLAYPKGSAHFFQRGTHLYVKCHYESTGKPEKIQPEVLLWMGEKESYRPVRDVRINFHDIYIPPGGKLSVEKKTEIPTEAKLFRCSLHMHRRGDSGKIEALLPDGSKQVLLSIPKFSFNRQWFSFAKPIYMPAHTVLVAHGEYDNSAQNPVNPDPTAAVQSGPNFKDEMFFVSCWYF
ncbi:MAG: redoxin domain-containing protein [Bdellovibrionota bacterium]